MSETLFEIPMEIHLAAATITNWAKKNGHHHWVFGGLCSRDFVDDAQRTPCCCEKLREAYDDMLVAEVKRYNGIPQLTKEEIHFREVVSEFLLVQSCSCQRTPASAGSDDEIARELTDKAWNNYAPNRPPTWMRVMGEDVAYQVALLACCAALRRSRVQPVTPVEVWRDFWTFVELPDKGDGKWAELSTGDVVPLVVAKSICAAHNSSWRNLGEDEKPDPKTDVKVWRFIGEHLLSARLVWQRKVSVQPGAEQEEKK